MRKYLIALLLSGLYFAAAAQTPAHILAQTDPRSQVQLDEALAEATASWENVDEARVVELLEAGALLDSLDRYGKMRAVMAVAHTGDRTLWFKYHGDESKMLFY
jgi:hypothetical protein